MGGWEKTPRTTNKMTECLYCGSQADLPFRCQYCDGVYCESHRLPEAHDCDGVEFLADPGKRFESTFTDEIVEEGEPIRSPEPIDPDYTVGTTPEPEYAPSPDVELKGREDDGPERSGVIGWLKRLIE